ncbi:MAG: zinc-ribbon domain-containing protein [bacterium]
MIVTCEACSTSFQLDEARIPATGARVRCSRCKHAFLLAHPSARESDDIHRIAAETAADEAAGTPKASADLSAPPSAASAPSGRFDSDPEEEDWQFNQDVRLAGEDDPALSGSRDPGAESDRSSDLDDETGSFIDREPYLGQPSGGEAGEGEAEASPIGLDLDASKPSPPTSPTPEEARDESNFGSVDDFSSWMEDEAPGGGDESAGAPSGLSGLAEAAPEGLSAGSGGRVQTARSGAEDLGDPESWDLIGSEGAMPTRSTRPGPVAARGSVRGGKRRGGLELSPDYLDGFGEAPAAEDLGEPSAWAVAAGKGGRFLGWLVTIFLAVTAIQAGLRPEWSRWAEAPQTASSGGFQAETRTTGWVETSRAGSVLVIRGQSHNASPEPIWPRPLQVRLLDGSGSPLAESPILAGEPLAEVILREAAPAELEAARLAAVDAYLGEPLAPGEVRPFEVVLRELPAQARRSLLEIGETLPEPSSEASASAARVAGSRADPGQLERVEDSFGPSP